MARAGKKPARSKPAAKAGRRAASRPKAKAKAKAKPAVTKPKATRAAKPTARRAAKPAAKPTVKTAKPKATAAATHASSPTPRTPVPVSDGVPHLGDADVRTSPSGRRRGLSARELQARPSPVVEILEDPHPIGALRRFLDSVRGQATEQQAQIALGSAQLMLLPIAREGRGGRDVKELLDLVIERWVDLDAPNTGFHAQEFLRNAFAAVGVDRARIAKLEALLPSRPSPELMFNVACAHAVARDKVAMLRAAEAALAAGASPIAFRRDADFAPYAGDPDLAAIVAHAELPKIPLDVGPHLAAVRVALDGVVTMLREFGEKAELRPPVRIDAILDAERVRKISLPNDYRALLSITNGMKLWGHEFLGAGDYRELTPLAQRASEFIRMASKYGTDGIDDCVPLANWGQPNDWLLYDPRGRVRRGDPGYVLLLNADEHPFADLAEALAYLGEIARDVLGTN